MPAYQLHTILLNLFYHLYTNSSNFLSNIHLIIMFRDFVELMHMKINNRSKVAMNIFHQARRRIALIAGLLGQFADAA